MYHCGCLRESRKGDGRTCTKCLGGGSRGCVDLKLWTAEIGGTSVKRLVDQVTNTSRGRINAVVAAPTDMYYGNPC